MYKDGIYRYENCEGYITSKNPCAHMDGPWRCPKYCIQLSSIFVKVSPTLNLVIG